MTRRGFLPLAIAALLVLTATFFASGRTVAQDTAATPSMTTPQMIAHPAHIHSGTCDNLGEVVYPLTDLTAPGMGGTPEAGMMASPSPTATEDASAMASASPTTGMGEVVAESTTTVNATLADLLATQYAINVHESMEQIQNYIACGEITGTQTGNSLTVTLNELNASGYHGEATLTDNGDGTTKVEVKLMESMGAMGTPVS